MTFPEDATTPQLLTAVRALAERIPAHDDARLLFEVAKRLERAEADYTLCVREIDRADRLQTHGMTHEDAWALVYIVHDTLPPARGKPGDIYAYLRTIRSSQSEKISPDIQERIRQLIEASHTEGQG